MEAEAALVVKMRSITDAWECCGYRRIGAELRHRGWVVNAKKVRRLMKLHNLNPRRRRRFTKTTESNHDGPIYPLITRNFEVHEPDQLWVGDITFVAIAAGFVYVSRVHLPHGPRVAICLCEAQALIDRHGFFGSMSRRGNPYDNPQAENFMKTLKVEAVYLNEYETYEDVDPTLEKWTGSGRRAFHVGR